MDVISFGTVSMEESRSQGAIRNGPPAEGRFAKFTAKFTPCLSSVDASIEPSMRADGGNAA